MKADFLDKAMSILLIVIVIFFAMTLISECPGAARGQIKHPNSFDNIRTTIQLYGVDSSGTANWVTGDSIAPTYRFHEPGNVVYERPPLTTWNFIFRLFAVMGLAAFLFIIMSLFLTSITNTDPKRGEKWKNP